MLEVDETYRQEDVRSGQRRGKEALLDDLRSIVN